VYVIVLEALFNASAAPNSSFQRFTFSSQFLPEKAGDEAFLTALRELQSALCITAGYGNILPTKFLKIPPLFNGLGTVNMHPSLLPLYRGAAPVQRALQDGVPETGVTLAFTVVRKLDSGPVIASKRFQVDDLIKAPELLSFLVSVVLSFLSVTSLDTRWVRKIKTSSPR
ncbi:predicted protein, partial [Arabidopsis lyrata subsp. lyrata]